MGKQKPYQRRKSKIAPLLATEHFPTSNFLQQATKVNGNYRVPHPNVSLPLSFPTSYFPVCLNALVVNSEDHGGK